MSRNNMLVPTNSMGAHIPDGYMLVQQVESNPNAVTNSNPRPPFGKNWNRNQKKREKREQLTASGGANSVKNLIPAQLPIASQPVVAQPMGQTAAEAGYSSTTQPGTESGKVGSGPTVDHPGYHTSDYARLRANMLAIRNQNHLSAEMMLNHVKKLVNYMYSFAKVLASPDPGAEFEVVRMWRYTSNGTYVIAGWNILNVVIEILFFFKTFGNPVEGDKFITPALECIRLHDSMVKGDFLRGWVEERIVQLTPEAIVDKLNTATKSETWLILRKFINVLDNCGQLTARLPQSTLQSCYKFVGNSDEPRLLSDAYNMATSTLYNKALNVLVMYVQQPHTPLLGVNQINALLKGTGISLSKFTGFAQVESRVTQREDDLNYPSHLGLLNLCGLPMPVFNQTEDVHRLMVKIDQLIKMQIQTSQRVDELRNMILQTSGVNQTTNVRIPGPMAGTEEQSIDSLLADEEGQDMEQGGNVIQLPVSNDGQVYGANYATPPPTADILAASVNSMMGDNGRQEQGREESKSQVPFDEVCEDLEHTIRT